MTTCATIALSMANIKKKKEKKREVLFQRFDLTRLLQQSAEVFQI